MLLDIAEESIRSAFGRRPPTLPDDLPAVLHECRGAFVTLHVAGALNGCIGAIVADEPLAPTVAADGTKVFELTAAITDWEVSPGNVVKAWTYNGMVPGPKLSVAPA